jgi:hypothetical protein
MRNLKIVQLERFIGMSSALESGIHSFSGYKI